MTWAGIAWVLLLNVWGGSCGCHASVDAAAPLEQVFVGLEDTLDRYARQLAAAVDAKCRVLGACHARHQRNCVVTGCGDGATEANGFGATNLTTAEALCGEGCAGVRASFNTSTVWLPEGIEGLEDPKLHAAVCFEVPVTLMHDRNRGAAVSPSPADDIVFRYWADAASGVFQLLPGMAQPRNGGGCSAYDPRVQPWYVGAATGPKDIIIILDMGESMGTSHTARPAGPSRAAAAKRAAERVLRTLNAYDRFLVVGVGSQYIQGASYITGSVSLQAAYPDVLDTAITNVYNAQPRGIAGVDEWTSAVRLAFAAVQRGKAAHRVGCATMALLVHDEGVAAAWPPRAGAGGGIAPPDTTVLDEIDAQQYALARVLKLSDPTTAKPVRFMTYSLGSTADATAAKAIACGSDGVWERVPDGGDLPAVMGRYYRLIAAAVARQRAVHEAPVTTWSQEYIHHEPARSREPGTAQPPHVDTLDYGGLVAASRAVYDFNTHAMPTLVGVLGVDVRVQRFAGVEGFSTSGFAARVWKNLGYRCMETVVDDCLLAAVRDVSSDAYQCPGGSATANAATRCGNITSAWVRGEGLGSDACDVRTSPGLVEGFDVNGLVCGRALDPGTRMPVGDPRPLDELVCPNPCPRQPRNDTAAPGILRDRTAIFAIGGAVFAAVLLVAAAMFFVVYYRAPPEARRRIPAPGAAAPGAPAPAGGDEEMAQRGRSLSTSSPRYHLHPANTIAVAPPPSCTPVAHPAQQGGANGGVYATATAPPLPGLDAEGYGAAM